MKLNIGTKINLLVVFFVLISSFSVGLVICNGGKSRIEAEVAHSLSVNIEKQKILISSEIESIKRDLTILSSLPEIYNYAAYYKLIKKDGNEKTKNISDIFQVLMKNRDLYSYISLIDVSGEGKELIKVERSGVDIVPTKYEDLKSMSDDYCFREVMQKNSHSFCFFKIGINKEEGRIVIPYKPVLKVAAPVYSEERMVAIIELSMDIGRFFNTIKNEFSGAGELYFINVEGDYLINPDESKIYGFDLGERFRIQDDYKGIGHFLDSSAFKDNDFRKVVSLKENNYLLGFSGVNYNKDDYRDFIGVVAEIPESYIYNIVLAVRYKALSVLLIFVISAIIVSNFVSGKVFSYLNDIAIAAKSLSYGEFKEALPVWLEDEIGELARGLRHIGDGMVEKISGLEKYNAYLQEQVSEMDGELKETLKTVDVANKTKVEFLRNINYEITTPINGIIGLMNLLKNTKLTEKQEEYISIMKSSVKSLLYMVNGIIDFSKIEMGRMSVDMVSFNIKEVVEDVAASFKANKKNDAVDLIVHWDERALTCVVGDIVKFKQVVYNLVSNALKFTEQGYVKIDVKSIASKANKYAYMVSVEDTGIGIAHDKLDYIFGKFNRIEGCSSFNLDGGVGLGLSICDELVKSMGGEMHVESVLGKGSKFWFTLFFEVSDKCSVIPLSNLQEKDRKEVLDKCKGLKALLVEDNKVDLIVMAELMKSYGCTVSVAGNGYEAVELFANNKFDIIFMDCNMPEMNGYEASQTMRRMERTLGIPETVIIALTANSNEGAEDKCFAYGMNHYIAKPVDEDKILKALQKWVVEKKAV